MKSPAQTDIAVLLLFFTRSDTFQLVFEAVRQARPSKLLLYQDGPRGPQDMAGIEACRSIVSDENIDWECEVHRRYLDHNEGCDPSGFRSHQWAFSLADKVMVLEDDVVPSLSFFPFCKEMLDKYEHDERISMVAGFNIDEISPDCEDSYFFTSAFSIWGWASWRRVAQRWDPTYAFMHNPETLKRLEAIAKECKANVIKFPEGITRLSIESNPYTGQLRGTLFETKAGTLSLPRTGNGIVEMIFVDKREPVEAKEFAETAARPEIRTYLLEEKRTRVIADYHYWLQSNSRITTPAKREKAAR